MLIISALSVSGPVVETLTTTRSSTRGACGDFSVPCHVPGKACANSGSAERSTVVNIFIRGLYVNIRSPTLSGVKLLRLPWTGDDRRAKRHKHITSEIFAAEVAPKGRGQTDASSLDICGRIS